MNSYITPHKEFFTFIYNRMKEVHGENPDLDYMISFRERIEDLFGTESKKGSFADILDKKKDQLARRMKNVISNDDMTVDEKMSALRDAIVRMDVLKEISKEAKKLEED